MARFASGFAGRPSAFFLGSFALLIVLGAFLLSLPIASTKGGLSPAQALFMAASAVCVTGLSVVDIGTELTPFGQWVILGLIQLGALGLMTFYAFFFTMLGQSIPFVHRTILRETVGGLSRGEQRPARVLRAIVGFSLAFEAAGTLALYGLFRRTEAPAEALKKAVFHAVSAFCNAGFSLQKDSFAQWRADPAMHLVLIALIVAGGLGFIAHMDLLDHLKKQIAWRWARGRNRPEEEAQPPRPALSLHTKVVLSASAALIVFGALVFWGEFLRAGGPAGQSALEALFLSVTARTAGFNTVPTEGLGDAVLFFAMILMFIGASPGSTGGGLKTTTGFVLLAALWSRFQGYDSPSAFRRTIPQDIVRRAGAILIMGAGVLGIALFAVLVLEEGNPALAGSPRRFLTLLFETVSAFGTVGLSMGVTASLSPVSLVLLSVLMYIGRIGPLTVFIALSEQPRSRPRPADELVMVG